MHKTKRTPITYKPQFGGEIFRPKDVVASELAALERQEPIGSLEHPSQHNDRPFDRRDEPSTVRTNERTKVRHSFDIYQDQLLSLAEIQASIFRKTRRKPKIGELVQEAIDHYIGNMERTTVRPNDRTNREAV